ncbi:MAG: glycosyltransferase family 4 protein [Planctomycetota bacterium]|jgi:glycosyltransferase involved in cell wall biosynthesis
MKIIFLVVRTDHASVYYRTLQFVPRLALAGIEPTVAIIPKRFFQRLALFARLGAYDLVIVQRKLFNLINYLPLRRNARKLIYDLDDALFIKDSKANARNSATRRRRFSRMVKGADMVLCGNDWIREKTAHLNPRCFTNPTVVDLAPYEPMKTRSLQGSFTALWIGSHSTLFYLEKILPALEPLKDKIPGFKLRVISDCFPESRTLPIEKVPWSRASEVSALREGDAGLMPLFEDDWSRGKCGLKLLQYGALGMPSVCTPVGVNLEIVRHNDSGFHAVTPADWQESLLALARDPALRARMGQKARQTVAEHFSLQARFKPFLGLLREITR